MSETTFDRIETRDGDITLNGVTGLTRKTYGAEAKKTVFTFANVDVTMTKNGTTSEGGGIKLGTFPPGLILPKLGSGDLVLSGQNASYLLSVGSVAAGTDGALSGTEANMLPSTAATVSAGVGTSKPKSTVTTPTPGSPLDGTTTAIEIWLNMALNADGTGKEVVRITSGTLTLNWEHGGDN